MKLRDAGLSFLGSVMIYVTMAACSGSGAANRATTTGGDTVASGGPGAGGAPATGPGLTDPVPSAAADPVSGRRLKARYRKADDGSKEYLAGSWFDSQRNENCSFGRAGDGVDRCLPDGVEIAVFGDAACTMPLIMVTTGCTAPAYAMRTDVGTCDTVAGSTHVLALGATTTPANLYLKTSATGCASAGPALTGFDYYGVGAEVPATSFVTATTGHD